MSCENFADQARSETDAQSLLIRAMEGMLRSDEALPRFYPATLHQYLVFILGVGLRIYDNLMPVVKLEAYYEVVGNVVRQVMERAGRVRANSQ